MVVDRLRTDLLNKLINARIDLAAYLQLRKAKGYMSVSESDTLRDNFFELNRELHDHALRQGLHLDQEEWKRAAPCRRRACSRRRLFNERTP